MPTEIPPPVYANVANVTVGAFDVILDFGYRSPEQMQHLPPEYEIVSRVAMSLSHAKSLLPLLSKVVAAYETAHGTIPAPGFEEDASS